MRKSKEKDIKDDEIRIIGKTEPQNKRSVLWLWLSIAAGVVLIVSILLFLFLPGNDRQNKKAIEELEQSLYDPIPEIKPVSDTMFLIGSYEETISEAYTEHAVRTINDIPIDIYIPHNAEPELMIGIPDIKDENLILAAQAADIRADNGKIVGAFVLKGKPYSWGLSKKGYCSIIDGEITVGVSENSPLFEEATGKEGYFFRQYALVNNGTLIDNYPKGKTIRKALCDRKGEIFIAMSQTNESFHDFAQALVDMEVDNAIYLVGSPYSYGFFRDLDARLMQFCFKNYCEHKYENYIIWKSKA